MTWHHFKGRGGSHTGCTRQACGKVRTDPVHREPVSKAGDADPKARKPRDWPAWKLEGPTAGHWAPALTKAVQQTLTPGQLSAAAAAYLADHPERRRDWQTRPQRRRSRLAAIAKLIHQAAQAPAATFGA